MAMSASVLDQKYGTNISNVQINPNWAKGTPKTTAVQSAAPHGITNSYEFISLNLAIILAEVLLSVAMHAIRKRTPESQ